MARREFVTVAGTAAAGAWLGLRGRALAAAPRAGLTQGMPMRQLGRTGSQAALVSLGAGGALAVPDNDATAVAVIERALDLGVNYIDTACRDANGVSQTYVGQVMARRRNQVFLAARTTDRTSEGCCRDMDAALQRLRTDRVDLYAIQDVRTMQEVDRIFAPGGAMEGFLYTKSERQTRLLGVTGVADPRVLMEMLRRYPFDVIQVGINAADRHHASFAADLLPLAAQQGTAVVATEVTARGRLLTTFTPGPSDAGVTAGPLTLRDALYYVLTLPLATALLDFATVGDVEEAVQLATAFAPLAPADMDDIAERTRPVARRALFFRAGV